MNYRKPAIPSLLFFSLLFPAFVGSSAVGRAQGGEGELGAEPVQGAITLSMMPPGDPKLSPPVMRQSSTSINYPDSLLRNRLQGKVELKALVGTDGSVTKVEILNSSGEPFGTLASDGVRGFQFSPATRDGAPVEAWMTIEVGFKIQDKWSTAYHGQGKGNSKSDDGSGDSWAYVADVVSPKMNSEEFQKNLVYPEAAKEKGIQGVVTIKALIDTNGGVLETQVEGQGDPLLAQAAMEAIRKTPFTPGSEEGERKPMWTMIPVNFGLHREGEEPTDVRSADSEDRGQLVEPQYDAKELQSHLEYFVEIESEETIQARVLIDELGSVKQVLVPDSADLLLSTAAVQAIKRTKFTPGRQNGDPIPVWISIPVTFRPKK